ncbi:MAG TPA: response regulator transcription factor [Opitutaceae bacterium]|nr:response regulator transcription factor [Opitutaceae bacterium]
MKSQAPKLVHIEDDAWSTQIVRTLVKRWPDVRHAGTAATAAAGYALCVDAAPAVALVDLRLPDTDGFTLARSLRSLPHAPRLVFLTGRADEAALFQLSRDPAAGFLWKSSAVADHLRPAVLAALAGRAYQPPEVRERLAAMRRDPVAFHKLFGESDLALLPLFGRGLSDDEIAAATGRAPLTIKWRRHQIMRKLDLHKASDLMRWARAKGFVDEAGGAASCEPAA